MPSLHRALLSVHDKTGLLELAQTLAAHRIELIATGGTARLLEQNGFAVTPVEAITGFPEILAGRVKTLHPKILGGLLARRDQPGHLAEAEHHGFGLIDLVVVNLYPFQQVIAQSQTTRSEALENIDIGGVTLLRAAAKNFPSVAVLSHPRQYAAFCEELAHNHGSVSEATTRQLAAAAFACTAAYDAAIQEYLQHPVEAVALPDSLVLLLDDKQTLRYGENPHQRAGFYRNSRGPAGGFFAARQLQGRALSYNNIVDADAALALVRCFDEPACVIIKHANPCGAAAAATPAEAFRLALATDPVSAFGGIVAFNRLVDGEAGAALAEQFTEVILAPGFNAEALRLLAGRKNLRLLEMEGISQPALPALEFKSVAGGVLVQELDGGNDEEAAFKVVTRRVPGEEEWRALRFAWKVVRAVKSNAVIFCRAGRTLGIGAGQMSRVDAAWLAVEKARRAGLELRGSVVASDAFFPFADGVEQAAAAGATAIIQPGGSVRDAEVIAVADRHEMAMVFTGVRHFRH
ncbi:MAG: bifunctional phosphoribosylaminoimidazolecarboxamide formyltransferase/IMP cyclohydrolase [candidate division KSB1 bacterium]|nr:bifunctional phosphoribosylaminoimidazolecarboxamide formyltransferase/IMP cyclohydrolase [candidate division KSB1 bacterium]MDZ7276022.1 bifunctional phosphoribosylaminoimidazolecarboxamide formyltransferase/IMP cyclohydrolase [candidate division KSB1 bacterium]MDZ7285696.1 bifunctional phosphoribosylaminoimidazolecarboxamide formyltransferase/IMP cyclohydrolase [candidate division KSB1 bacterium]MDZ7298728.1 bifunctional phosphoribosylaminoimidazolecarboxamide formyltransferase/IMP cyclohyd